MTNICVDILMYSIWLHLLEFEVRDISFSHVRSRMVQIYSNYVIQEANKL